MSNTKQVIVIRKDLKMRRGKEIAQSAHSAMAFITREIKWHPDGSFTCTPENPLQAKSWMEDSFTKITVTVDSEEELLDIYQKAKDNGLTASLITDKGLTEFKGIPTNTCVCIGPNFSDNIDKITGHLKLY